MVSASWTAGFLAWCTEHGIYLLDRDGEYFRQMDAVDFVSIEVVVGDRALTVPVVFHNELLKRSTGRATAAYVFGGYHGPHMVAVEAGGNRGKKDTESGR